jgi:LEM3 (ligand-effect modulator 3) family / CDC50 family
MTLDFNVTAFGGTKSIVITTTTVMGGKNPFLGIAYVVVGGICIILGALFTVTYLIKPRYVLEIVPLGEGRLTGWYQKTGRSHIPHMGRRSTNHCCSIRTGYPGHIEQCLI